MMLDARAACVRASVPGGGRAARLFLPWLNLAVVEHDLAVLKVARPEHLACRQRRIWPACLPDKVTTRVPKFAENLKPNHNKQTKDFLDERQQPNFNLKPTSWSKAYCVL